ncbi:MAG: hypothetical protein WBQ11_22405, partial [Isosphaeraceae bacterium]
LQDLLASFRQAVADPADRMTHLYEIRDALNRHFGGEKTARNQLGLTHKGWSDLGRIANKEPIEESRHRGCHPPYDRPPRMTKVGYLPSPGA